MQRTVELADVRCPECNGFLNWTEEARYNHQLGEYAVKKDYQCSECPVHIPAFGTDSIKVEEE